MCRLVSKKVQKKVQKFARHHWRLWEYWQVERMDFGQTIVVVYRHLRSGSAAGHAAGASAELVGELPYVHSDVSVLVPLVYLLEGNLWLAVEEQGLLVLAHPLVCLSDR